MTNPAPVRSSLDSGAQLTALKRALVRAVASALVKELREATDAGRDQ